MNPNHKPFLGNRKRDHDPVWHVQLVVIGAMLLQLILPARFVAGPHYSIVLLEALLVIALVITTPRLEIFESKRRRINVTALVLLIGGANAYSLLRVVQDLLAGGRIASGPDLIYAAVNIYLTNIVIFALLYWEMDGGGPGKRRGVSLEERDFLYPQASNAELRAVWHPTFIDYLYVSGTNATSFGPTDTNPISRRAKMLMLLQSTVALTTLALLATRAVSILK